MFFQEGFSTRYRWLGCSSASSLTTGPRAQSVSLEEMLRRHWLYHVPEHPFSAWERRSCSERGRLYHQVVPSSCFPLLTGHEFESLLSVFLFFMESSSMYLFSSRLPAQLDKSLVMGAGCVLSGLELVQKTRTNWLGWLEKPAAAAR